MNPADWPAGLAYVVVFLAAVVEGELVFVTASVLVGRGQLHPLGVLVAGALGGSVGDQFFFFALRGRLHGWLDRFPQVARQKQAVMSKVRRHSTLMTLGCRFLPGLRIAIPAACAYAGVAPLKFSTLSLAGALAWAAAIMAAVAWVGPAVLSQLGLQGRWGLIVPAVLIVLFFRWLGSASAALRDAPSE